MDASPGAVIYDTRKHGKPDMVKLTCEFMRLSLFFAGLNSRETDRLVKEFNAEAV